MRFLIFPLFYLCILSINLSAAEDHFKVLHTRSGLSYTNVYVDQVYPDSLLISHAKGTKQISLKDLSEDLQKKYGYEPDKARDAVAQRLKSDEEWKANRQVKPKQASPSRGTSSSPSAGNWLDNFEEAMEKARSENKLLFINFTGSDWCGWCIKLKKEVFQTEEFSQFASEKFVLLECDFPRKIHQEAWLVQQNRQLQRKFEIRGYPTLIIWNPANNRAQSMGYVPGGPKAFISEFNKIAKL